MAYRKLTKKQWRNRERVLAWLNDEEFKENSRAEPAVPNLSLGEVLEFYVPPDVTGAGQFFTPAEMSEELAGVLPILNNSEIKVLDPCAGIGHLLWPWADMSCQLVAYELERECVEIGKRLFPSVEWHGEIPFDCLDQIEGQFDFVVMNPPFNTRRGMDPGVRMCEGRCTKSEHVFLELAVRACKPDGQIGVIAPFNYWERIPKKLRAWLEDKVILEHRMGELPGKFEMSNIKVHGYIIGRSDEVLAWVQAVNEKGRELDDLCSTTHPTAWHEDPDIVAKQAEWKELAGGGTKPTLAEIAKVRQLPLF